MVRLSHGNLTSTIAREMIQHSAKRYGRILALNSIQMGQK